MIYQAIKFHLSVLLAFISIMCIELVPERQDSLFKSVCVSKLLHVDCHTSEMIFVNKEINVLLNKEMNKHFAQYIN